MNELYGKLFNPFSNTVEICGEVLDEERPFLPEFGGIYFVYAGPLSRGEGWFRIQPARLLYIGEAKSLYERHNDEYGNPIHEHYKDFVASLKQGETLVYAFARVPNVYLRKTIESALIYNFQPPINIKQKQTYTHRDMHLSINVSSKDILFPLIGEYDIQQG